MVFGANNFEKIKKIAEKSVLPVVIPLVEGLTEEEVTALFHYANAAIKERVPYGKVNVALAGEKPETTKDGEVCSSVESAKMRLSNVKRRTCNSHSSLREEL